MNVFLLSINIPCKVISSLASRLDEDVPPVFFCVELFERFTNVDFTDVAVDGRESSPLFL